MARNGSNWPRNKWLAATLDRSSVSLSSIIEASAETSSYTCIVQRECEERERSVENAVVKMWLI